MSSLLEYAGLVSALISLAFITLSQVRYFAAVASRKAQKKTKEGMEFFGFISYRSWKRTHIASQVIFMVAILVLSPVELLAGLLYGQDFYEETYLHYARHLDHFLALPSLAVATTSGAAITFNLYLGRNKQVPWNVDRAMWMIAGWGVYWVLCDKITQFFPVSCWIRGVINLGSCAMAVYIWSLGRVGRVTSGAIANGASCKRVNE